MPRKKQGEGAQVRYNKKRPIIAFRSPDPDFKARVQAEAERVGMSVNEYLIQAVNSYMAVGNMKDHHIPRETLMASVRATTAEMKAALPNAEKERLADILKDLETE